MTDNNDLHQAVDSHVQKSSMVNDASRTDDGDNKSAETRASLSSTTVVEEKKRKMFMVGAKAVAPDKPMRAELSKFPAEGRCGLAIHSVKLTLAALNLVGTTWRHDEKHPCIDAYFMASTTEQEMFDPKWFKSVESSSLVCSIFWATEKELAKVGLSELLPVDDWKQFWAGIMPKSTGIEASKDTSATASLPLL